jgi:hypothetical protein
VKRAAWFQVGVYTHFMSKLYERCWRFEFTNLTWSLRRAWPDCRRRGRVDKIFEERLSPTCRVALREITWTKRAFAPVVRCLNVVGCLQGRLEKRFFGHGDFRAQTQVRRWPAIPRDRRAREQSLLDVTIARTCEDVTTPRLSLAPGQKTYSPARRSGFIWRSVVIGELYRR